MKLTIVQTHVQHYRLSVFDELRRRIGAACVVYSGKSSFSPTTSSPAVVREWHRTARNHFMFGRRLLWQSGHFHDAVWAELCILEFNPRILSNWGILLLRRLRRRETVLWGHLFPRAGERAASRIFRFWMTKLATRLNLYTEAEAEQCRRMFPRKAANVAPNAVMWQHECRFAVDSLRRRVLFVSRLIPDKKPLLLLEAFALAVDRLPATVCLDFIGGGPLEATLKARTCELGLEQRVSIHGEIYGTSELRQYYDEAICAVSPGYVGLSATQAFGFGVPMLIARRERHSVEISLCEPGFNCAYFESNDPDSLAAALVQMAPSSPTGITARDAIAERIRHTYTLDRMCDGFARLLAPPGPREPARTSPPIIGVLWMGFPYYAARAIREAKLRHPEWRFVIVSSNVGIPYRDLENMVGEKIHWIDQDDRPSWREFSGGVPDLVLVTSWPHPAFNDLVRQARDARGTPVVCMVDNFLRYTLRQLLGAVYFRLVLRRRYAAMWVPGKAGARFMDFLGVAPNYVYQGLYAGDSGIFSPPPPDAVRHGLLFVGQLIPRKGLRPLASLWRQRRDTGEAPDLTIVGAGPLEADLRASGISVLGFKQPRELVEYYRRASALILPSRIDHWGVVVHEAALCGCLLLVTRQCGCSADLVQHGINGFVMKQGSTEEIAAALHWLESLSPERVRAGRELSVRLAHQITPGAWADTLERMVGRLVLGRQRFETEAQ